MSSALSVGAYPFSGILRISLALLYRIGGYAYAIKSNLLVYTIKDKHNRYQ